MNFSIPFSLSNEENCLFSLYSAINDVVSDPGTSWNLVKEESVAPKSAKVTGFMEIHHDGNVRKTPSFTIICEEESPRDVLVAKANIKLLVMCCNFFALPIEFSFKKEKVLTEFKPVKSWRSTAEEHGIQPLDVVQCQDIKSLIRYCKVSKFPILQALEATAQKFGSERVTVKQFFEFVWGEASYGKVKELTKKRKATKTLIEEAVSEPEEIPTSQETTYEGRDMADMRRVIALFVEAGINSVNFADYCPNYAEEYGSFQYFCTYAKDEEISLAITSAKNGDKA